MKSSNSINQKNVELSVLAIVVVAILLVMAQAIFAQIRIGGITIGGVKRPATVNGGKQTGEAEPQNQGIASNVSLDEPPEWFVKVMVGDIQKAKEEVESYTAEGKIYLVSTPSSPWLLRAVSPKAREAFAIDKKFNDWRKANSGNKYDAGLDALASSAAKKLPEYLPKPNQFELRDAAIEQMMKAKLKNAPTLKISKIGVLHANWQIEKNDLGIPVNRYREAFIWGKDSSDDHPYCHVYGFVIQQDYAGGGTYGATYAYVNTDVLFGCSAK